MALPASGLISLSAVNTELSKAATANITLNDANVRALFGVASGPISLANGYGKSAVVTVNIALTIAANTKNYNIWNSKGGSYSAGHTNVTLTINAGIVVGSTSTATYALSTGTGWSGSDTISIVNNGYIVGKGGQGGDGVCEPSGYLTNNYTGNAGKGSGPALLLNWATTITNAAGYIYSGGGGGRGGFAVYDGHTSNLNTRPRGAGGAGNSVGRPGQHGSGWPSLDTNYAPYHTNFFNSHYGGVNGDANLTHGGNYWVVYLPQYGGRQVLAPGGALNVKPAAAIASWPAGGGGGGASGGDGTAPSRGPSGGGHALAIQRNGYALTWVSGNTRVYGGVS